MLEKIKTALLDCDAGRKLGCKSFCCRLLVRLEEHERNEIDPVTNRAKGSSTKKKMEPVCIRMKKPVYVKIGKTALKFVENMIVIMISYYKLF